MFFKIVLVSLLLRISYGQQIGTLATETHPPMTWQQCTAPGSCTTIAGTVTLDSNWRWTHSTNSSTNCYTGNTWDATLCPDDVTCAENCAVDGADYPGTYGVTASGNSLKIDFVTQSSQKNVGARLYLLADETHYQEFHLLQQEFTFDVDVSNLPCGLNGALYMSAMPADGGVSTQPNNKAGAKYGVGYCDSQCPRDLKWIAGKGNVDGWVPASNSANTGLGNNGACCSEMDIWEANSISTALTPHSCSPDTLTVCTGNTCGGTYSTNRYAGTCDPDGCDFNSYRMGNETFYGPGLTVDTNSKFTVVTQFLTDTGTSSGTMNEIKRFYVQNGVVIPNSQSTISGVTGNSITEAYCTAQKTAFGDTNTWDQHGSWASMTSAMQDGMVLVMSLWDDYYADMLWLDSTYPTTKSASTPGVGRGTCSTSSGVPATIESSESNAYVIYSNIKVGAINSTFSGTTSSGGGSGTSSSSKAATTLTTSTTSAKAATTLTTSTTSAKAATTLTTSTTSATTSTTTAAGSGSGTAGHWAQCAGLGYTGPIACASGYTCTYFNPWYSQCL